MRAGAGGSFTYRALVLGLVAFTFGVSAATTRRAPPASDYSSDETLHHLLDEADGAGWDPDGRPHTAASTVADPRFFAAAAAT